MFLLLSLTAVATVVARSVGAKPAAVLAVGSGSTCCAVHSAARHLGMALAVALLACRGSAVVAQQPTDATPPAAVVLQAGTWKNVTELVRQHAGKIVVVDIWSTSCLPCMTEFPNLVALQKAHPEQVVCISFNVDYVGIKSKPAETYRERVEKFLNKQQATFPNFLCTQEADAVFAELKLTSIPAVYVYGRDGKLAKRFDDSLLADGREEAFTYTADINPFVASLLAKPAP